jgi:hypothetical protein
MAKELGEPRVVAKPQREHVVFALEHDRLPPAVDETLLRDDEVARRDLVPGAGQATGERGAGLVVVWSDRRLVRFGRQRDEDLTELSGLGNEVGVGTDEPGAARMGLEVYKASSPDVAEVAKKPAGRPGLCHRPRVSASCR